MVVEFKKTILYPSSINWSFMFQRPQQLMRMFAKKGYKSVFMDKVVQLPGAVNRDEPYIPEPNLTVLPEGSEMPNFDILYFTYPPPGAELMCKHPDKLSVFDACDLPEGAFNFWNYGGAWDYCVENADIVLASSQYLIEKIKEKGIDPIYVPNAVDPQNFVWEKDVPFPSEFQDIPEPRVLYTGAIASWFDKELVYKVSEMLPNISFIYVGASMNDSLYGPNDNMYLLGHKPYERMAEFLYHSDVLTIPFRHDDPIIKATNPIKVWEYLLTGKPIVTTKIPECENIQWGEQKGRIVNPYLDKGPIYISETPDAFAKNIEMALEETKHYRNGWTPKIGRIQIAMRNTWSSRADRIIEEINKCQQ